MSELTSMMTSPTPVDAIDRRIELRCEMDRRLVGALLTAITIAISVGVAWGTATARLAQKVDRSDQLQVDAAQDRQIDSLRTQGNAVGSALMRIQISVDSANLRLRQLACDGKPSSCR